MKTEQTQEPADTATRKSASGKTVCLCLAALALAIAYLSPVCFILRHHSELGRIPLGADLLVRGHYLYRDMFSEAFPGSYFLLALFFQLFGSTFFAARLELLLTFLASACLITLLARKIISGWLSFVPAAIYVIVAAPSWCINYFYWDATTFFLGCALCLTELTAAASPSLVAAAAAGLSGGLAVLCFQGLGPPVIAGFLSSGLLVAIKSGNRRQALKALALMFGFAALVALCLLAYLLATGTLAQMFDCTVRKVVFDYADINKAPYGANNFSDAAFFGQVTAPGHELEAAIGLFFALACWWPWQIVLLAPAAVAVALIFYFLRGGKAKAALLQHQTVILWMVLGYGFWAVQLHRPDIQRLFWGSILLLIITVHLIQRGASSPGAGRIACKLLTVWTVLSLSLYALTNVALYSQPKAILSCRRGNILSLSSLPVVNALEKVTAPYETVLVYPYDTAINFLSMTSFPGRFPFLMYHYNSPGDMQQTISAMERQKEQHAVLDLQHNNQTHRDLGFPSYEPVGRDELIMENYLRDNFRAVKVYGIYRLLKRKT